VLKFDQYHFVGVAGVGMSAVAQAICFQGCSVTGSDRHYDKGVAVPVLRQLERAGIRLFAQDGSGVAGGAQAVVVSTAIESDNPDLVEAATRGLPVLHRSEVLAQLVDGKTCIAVAGTSGKSTVTGMVGWILQQAGLDPTVVNGAPISNWRNDVCIGNARKGAGDLWVIEADESDRSLLNYAPAYAVITNMSADHFDLPETVDLFRQFKAKVVKQCLGALDNAEYLDDLDATVTASSSRFSCEGVSFVLPLPGRHNVEDALHAAKLCQCVGVTLAQSAAALATFRGIHRRLEVVGQAAGVTVLDDYGHNPAKIAAAWKAVVPFARRGIVIWRPHGYGPLRSLMDELVDTFADLCQSDDRLLLLPVYDAGGTADRSIGVDALADRLKARAVPVSCVSSHDEALAVATAEAEPGDVVVVMGARDPELPALAKRILQEIEALELSSASLRVRRERS
jgi:UDP-N-acetylmuramate--alanine ligase